MKKWLLVVCAVLFVTPAVMAGNWGIGLKAGMGQNDPKGMKADRDRATYQDYFNEHSGYAGVEILHEWGFGNGKHRLGAKIEGDMYQQNKFSGNWGGFPPSVFVTEKETTYAIPLTLYYKQDNGVGAFSWYVGGGISFLRTDVKVHVNNNHSRLKEDTFFSHVVLGTEYRFVKAFALGLEGRYNINAKIKKNGAVLADRSGFGGAVTMRFYF